MMINKRLDKKEKNNEANKQKLFLKMLRNIYLPGTLPGPLSMLTPW